MFSDVVTLKPMTMPDTKYTHQIHNSPETEAMVIFCLLCIFDGPQIVNLREKWQNPNRSRIELEQMSSLRTDVAHFT